MRHHQPSVPEPYGLAALCFLVLESDCSAEIQSVLLNSRKPSTHKTYLQKWKHFLFWCSYHSISVSEALRARILDYLFELKKQELSMSFVKVTPSSYYGL